MCGHVFEGDSDDASESAEPHRKRSRVRQRTISVSREEVDELASDSARSYEQESSAGQPDEDERFAFHDRYSPEQAEEQESEDSVPEASGTYDDTFEVDEPTATGTEAPFAFSEVDAPHEPIAMSDEPEADDTLFGVSSYATEDPYTPPEFETAAFSDSEQEVYSEPPGASPSAEASEDDEAVFESEDDADGEGDDDESGEEEQSVVEGESRSKRRRRRRRKRRAATPSESQHEPTAPTDSDESVQQVQSHEDEFRRNEAMSTQETAIDQQPYTNANQSGSGRSEPGRGIGAAPNREGDLVGWFVTYGPDARGASVEVRSGRFFIGRQKLRQYDMVIGDTAISTPHCLVSASVGEGIRIQDLMSEQGTFIKKRGRDSFVRVEDVVSVEHGDTLRFGAYEVLVCLVG
ncbi:MAG: FHA domain-containing protein [Bdellovibrionales bacterium]|nr:FHA domain-containing protein [Bdellovibrionales bacterium]